MRGRHHTRSAKHEPRMRDRGAFSSCSGASSVERYARAGADRAIGYCPPTRYAISREHQDAIWVARPLSRRWSEMSANNGCARAVSSYADACVKSPAYCSPRAVRAARNWPWHGTGTSRGRLVRQFHEQRAGDLVGPGRRFAVVVFIRCIPWRSLPRVEISNSTGACCFLRLACRYCAVFFSDWPRSACSSAQTGTALRSGTGA